MIVKEKRDYDRGYGQAGVTDIITSGDGNAFTVSEWTRITAVSELHPFHRQLIGGPSPPTWRPTTPAAKRGQTDVVRYGQDPYAPEHVAVARGSLCSLGSSSGNTREQRYREADNETESGLTACSLGAQDALCEASILSSYHPRNKVCF